MKKRMLVYLSLFILMVAFGLWAYHAMIKIRPHANRPKLSPDDLKMIDEFERGLQTHIMAFAETIGPRNVFLPDKLNAASEYIRAFWKSIGYDVKAQDFLVHKIACQNLFVEIPGSLTPDEIIIIGAHYDTVSSSPGANDNGSGVAALLEISRLFKSKSPHRTLRFVAFVNEEPPFFKTSSMGSFVYARECRQRKDHIAGMVCLETIGYYTDQDKTQKYPFPLNFFYPNQGNFVAVVGNLRSKSLVISFTRNFMEETDFPVECGALFGLIPGIDWSDHWSFWRFGYPAIMITDTALFRYPFYHSHLDTIDKIDFRALARVTHGIYKALSRMIE